MRPPSPFWIAQRHGQDWIDQDVLRAIDWLTSVVPSRDWAKRLAQTKQNFESAKSAWADGNQAPLFDPKDTMAWYVFQASAYASNREDWYEPEAFRIVPVLRRLGQILPRLTLVDGVMDRVQHLMTGGRGQPDDGLFELLVAGAYKRVWDKVALVAERPGVAKTQDILVSASRRRWAVECKRVNQSGYEKTEQSKAKLLAEMVHALCKSRRRSIVVEVNFKVELSDVPVPYLMERARAFLDRSSNGRWDDEFGKGAVRNVDWTLARAVLEQDDVFFGSSRMVELLVGRYSSTVDHSVAAEWIPAEARPLHATSVSQASVVSWMSGSIEAAQHRARHFRALVANATLQLPDDCPGVIHVGYEARTGNGGDGFRHHLNSLEMRTFDPKEKRLRWVYGNYLLPEHPTARNESAAMTETTATYKIGRHQTPEPLADHGLLSDDLSELGGYWD
jgi:hypothetical protein